MRTVPDHSVEPKPTLGTRLTEGVPGTTGVAVAAAVAARWPCAALPLKALPPGMSRGPVA